MSTRRENQVTGRSMARMRAVIAGLGTLALTTGMVAVGLPAAAATSDVVVNLSQLTGLAGTLDQATGPGYDTSQDDTTIRTNDVIQYDIEVGIKEGATEGITAPFVTFTLPQGQQFVDIVNGVPTFQDLKGGYNVQAPAYCGPGSGISYTGGATTMPSPNYAALSANEYHNLPQQTLTCYLEGDVTPGVGRSITLYASVRPEVPNATAFDGVTATVDGTNIDAVASNAVNQVVSSGSKWDLSVNGSQVMPARQNTDFIKQNGIQTCTQNYGPNTGAVQGTATGLAQQLCYVGGFSVTLSTPSYGYGGTPIAAGDFSYTFDLSPASIWSVPAYENGVDTGKTVYQYVEEYNAANPGDEIVLPGGYLTLTQGGQGTVFQSAGTIISPTDAASTVWNAVRNSGTTTLGHYVAGETATLNVKGADTTAYTTPIWAGSPNNHRLWDERGYVYAQRVFIEVPMTVVTQNFEFFDSLDPLGTDGSVNSRTFISVPQSSLTYTSINGMSVAETNQYTDADREFNNFRNIPWGFINRILVGNVWSSPVAVGDVRATSPLVEGPSTATAPDRFIQGNPGLYGTSGETSIYAGDGVAVAGERVLNTLIYEGQTYDGGGTLTCTAFNNAEVVLDPTTASTSTSTGLQVQNTGPTRFPSYSDVDNGGAVWIYGTMYQYAGATREDATGNTAVQAGMADRYPEFSVWYGVGAALDTTCAEPITWYTLDQVIAGTVKWSDINKVEVYLEHYPGGNVAEFRTNVSMGMTTLANPAGTLIETHTNYSQVWFTPRRDATSQSAATAHEAVYGPAGAPTAPAWQQVTGYDEVANNGSPQLPFRLGDRLTAVDALARVSKAVTNPAGQFVRTDLWSPADSTQVVNQPPLAADISGEYIDYGNVPIYGPGSTFEYRLQPTVDANPMPAAGEMIRDVLLEDCLPTSVVLNYSAAPTGSFAMYTQDNLNAGTLPYHKTPMACQPGEFYVAFWWPQFDISKPLEEIVLPVRVLETAMTGELINQAQMSLMKGQTSTTSDADPSLFTQRSDRARVAIQAPNGLEIAKSTTTPVIFVDDLGLVSSPTVTWNLEVRNINSGSTISNVDVIDYLPESGVEGSGYTGDREFLSATVATGTGVELYFTKATLGGLTVTQWSDATSAANQAGGSTVWCTRDGTATYPAGGDLTECPASAAEVTGVRAVHADAFPNGASFSVNIVQSAEDRLGGDVMMNQTQLRAHGIDVPLFSVATAVWDDRDVPPNPGTIEGDIWDDLNVNGIWDEGEPPLSGVVVTATGTPTWCAEKWNDIFADCAPVTLTATTNPAGHYVISNVYPGLPTAADPAGPREPYTVRFTTPDGYSPTIPGRSLAPQTTVELNADNQFITGVDAGYIAPATLEVSKAVVDAATGAAPAATTVGDELRYTVTITNTSNRVFTEATPAAVIDDLSGVLWGATLIDGPTATAGTVSTLGDLVGWYGLLAAGESVELTYTVRVTQAGPGGLTNVAFSSTDPVNPDSGFPEDPDTGTPPATPAECVEPSCASTTTQLGALAVAKSVTVGGAATTSAVVGDTLTYTVTVTNTSEADYPATRPATFVDSLADVLDNGTLDEATITASAGHVQLVGTNLIWYGPLAPGASATVTYQVTSTSDGYAVNVAFVTPPGVIDDDGPDGPNPPILPVDPETDTPVVPPAQCVEPTCATTTTTIGTPPPPPPTIPPTTPPTVPPTAPTTPGQKPMPPTGADVSGVLMGAGMLLAAGVVAMGLRRRRLS